MAKGARRALTEGEKAFADEAFRGRIDLGKVGIQHGAGLNPVAAIPLMVADGVTLIRTIYFRGDPVADYSKGGDKLLLLHEMTHVWQYQTIGVLRFGLRYLRELAAARGDRKAMYGYNSGDAFDRATLEAQADMVRDYARGGAPRAKAEPSLKGTGFFGLA